MKAICKYTTEHTVRLCAKGGKFFLVDAQIDTDDEGRAIYGTFEIEPAQAFAFATELAGMDRRIAALIMGVPEDARWFSGTA